MIRTRRYLPYILLAVAKRAGEEVYDGLLMLGALVILLPLWGFLAVVYWGDGVEGLA